MKISIIIPANNEEKTLKKCPDSIKSADLPSNIELEIIVVLNSCTDMTGKIAILYGSKIFNDDSRCLSQIRNKGVEYATGKIIVTIDADSWMSQNMLIDIYNSLTTNKYIGGGVKVFPERYSLDINV